MNAIDKIEGMCESARWETGDEFYRNAHNCFVDRVADACRERKQADCNFSRFKGYDEAWEAFEAMCDAHEGCRDCPMYRGDANAFGAFECFGRWLWESDEKGSVK